MQDLGLVRLIKRLAPTLPIHGSTQMTLTEARGIEFVRRLGVERVIVARELSVEDIRKFSPQTPMPLEVFVHGALCVAYSGQCLTSEALGGRSANRGQCAQACRMPYALVVDGSVRDLGDKAYLLSPQDLAAYDSIAALTKAGVVSFKIEGRLKGAPYVAQTTQTYRAAVDAALAGQPFELPENELRDLNQVYSRGFVPGFLEGVNHQKLVAGRFPKNRGVRAGIVTGTTKRGVLVRPEIELKPGDGVVFDVGRPEEQEAGGRIFEIHDHSFSGKPKAPAGAPTVELRFGDELTAPPGALVWKTDDPALRKRLEQTFASDHIVHRVPLHLNVTGRIGEPLRVTARTAEFSASAEWPGPLEAARKQPLTLESIREQFGRLSDTPFVLGDVELNLPDAVMVPRSKLNDLRRRLVADLMPQRERAAVHAVAEPAALAHFRAAARSPLPDSRNLTVLVRNFDQLDAALEFRPAMVYCEFEDVRRYRDAVSRARAAGVPIGLATLRVVKPGEEGFLRTIAGLEPDAVLIRNLAGLTFFRDAAPHIRRIGDFALNVANDLTAALFFEEGLERVVPSFDLNWEQFAALARHTDASRLEVVIHQHMPMFHNEHCVFAAALSNGKDWRDCGRPCDTHRVELRDRSGAAFPLVADAGCRNTVFNAVPQSAAEYLPRMLALGICHFRVDLLREEAREVGPLLERYCRVLDGKDDGRELWRSLRALNQLGVTRGTLQLV